MGHSRRQSAGEPPINWSGERPSSSRTRRSARLHPGQDRAGCDQDREQRDGARSAAQRAGRDREGRRQHQPLPRQRVCRAEGTPGQARRLRPRAHLGGLRVGQPVPAADPDHLDRRRRGGLRLAQLRDLPSAGPHRGCDARDVDVHQHAEDVGDPPRTGGQPLVPAEEREQ